jgi:hypothetical protein
MTSGKVARNAGRAAAMVGMGVALLAGCGGGGGGKTVTETDFCAQKADAECQVADRCVTDKTACKADRMTVCAAFLAQAKSNGKRFFVAGNVSACINKTKSVYAKTAAITPADLADVDDVCQYVFQGKGKVNLDNCDTKYDCADRVICDKTFCATQKSVTAACGNPGDVCPTGNYCTMNSSSLFVCMAKGASGETCDGNKPCLESLRCAAGVCTDRVASAGSCGSNDDCAAAAPYCDPSAGNKCDMGLLFAPNASSCADFGGTGSGPGTGGAGGSTGAGGSSGGAGRGGVGAAVAAAAATLAAADRSGAVAPEVAATLAAAAVPAPAAPERRKQPATRAVRSPHIPDHRPGARAGSRAARAR